MAKANKKQRHEAKRKAKRQASRRREAFSPVKRLADAPGEPECWISDGFEMLGQMQMFVYKRGGGVSGMAAFLVDRGVVGLKDAWVNMQMDRAEFADILNRSRRPNLTMRRVTVDEVRDWVAGALRWAHDNGMRLPRDWAKAASFVGGVGDWRSADVSAFVKEFAGHPEDLRQRLIGEPLESYLRRDDVEFIFNTDAPYMDQRTGQYSNNEPSLEDYSDEELEEMEAVAADVPTEELNEMAIQLVPAARALTVDTAAWLDAQGEQASGELAEAWCSVMVATMMSKSAMPDAGREELRDFTFELLDDISGRIDESRAAEYDRAIDQVLRHLETDPMMMQKAVLQHPPLDEPSAE